MGFCYKKIFVCAVVVGFSVHRLWKLYKDFLKKEKFTYKCLFFSPNQMGCTALCKADPNELSQTVTCNNCSVNTLVSHLMKANKCLDICLYLVTSEKLFEVILNLFKLGVHVRIIVDKNISEEAFGAKALLFQKAYVPLKIIECHHMMHNKFAIIDNETVLTGSLNWTNAGFYGNYENLLIISHKGIAKEYRRKNSKLTEGPVKTQEKNFSSKIAARDKLLENTGTAPQPPRSAKSKISTTSEKRIIPSPARDESRPAKSVKTDSGTGEKKIGGRGTVSGKSSGPPRQKADQERSVNATSNSAPRIQSSGNTGKYSSDYYQKFLGLRKPMKGTAAEKTNVKNFASIPKLENKENVINKKHNSQTENNSGRLAGSKKPGNFTPAAKVEAEKMPSKSPNPRKNPDPSKFVKNRRGDVEDSGVKAVLLNPKLPAPSSASRRASSKEKQEKSHVISDKSRKVKRMKSEGDSLHFKNGPSTARKMETEPRSAVSEIKDLNLNNKHKDKPHFTVKLNCKESGIKSVVKKENPIPKSKNVPDPVLKNEILHVNMMTDAKLGSNVKEKEEEKVVSKEERPLSQKLPPLDNSAIRPTETFDSFDSLDKGNYDELLSLDHMIWNDLEKKIKEACGKTGDIYDSEDDTGESLSDIISKLSLDDEKELSKSSEKEKSVAVNIHGKQIPGLNQVHMEKVAPVIVKPEKRSAEHEARANIQEPRNESVDSSVEIGAASKIEKSKVSDSSNRDQYKIVHEEKFEQLIPVTTVSREVPTSPTGFFKTHKKLGFIGKVEDEECASFDVGQVKLYQPFESQMLFYDVANCIATQAYLKMCGLNYELEVRKNAEHMSPSGKVPFLSSCLCIIPEFEGIISFMQCKKFACFRIDENEKTSFRSMISMIKNTLESAERYICWYDEETVNNYTKPRIGGMFPFPLNHILYWLKGYEERRNLKDEGRREISFDVILREINACFRVLSQHLGDNSFFFGNISTEIDALVYGHLYAFLTAEKEGIFKDLNLIIKQFPNLITFAINFDKIFLLNKFPPVDSL